MRLLFPIFGHFLLVLNHPPGTFLLVPISNLLCKKDVKPLPGVFCWLGSWFQIVLISYQLRTCRTHHIHIHVSNLSWKTQLSDKIGPENPYYKSPWGWKGAHCAGSDLLSQLSLLPYVSLGQNPFTCTVWPLQEPLSLWQDRLRILMSLPQWGFAWSSCCLGTLREFSDGVIRHYMIQKENWSISSALGYWTEHSKGYLKPSCWGCYLCFSAHF